MKHSLLVAVLLSLTCLSFTAVPQKSAAAARVDDPFLCLEEIEEPRALDWARAENDKTLGALQSDPRNRRFYEEALSILQAKDRISYVSLERRGLSNFSQDENHVRGIWRRTTLDSYRGQDPHWETILDIDALAVTDKKNWVFKGATCLPPQERMCLVQCSDGGKDAVLVREFDTDTNAFVTTDFALPEGKLAVSWVDRHTVLIARDWGEGTLTQVGYPFVLKELKRAQPLVRAREVFPGEPTDAVAAPFVLRHNEGKVHAAGAMRAISFFEQEYVLFGPNGPIKLNLPKKANISGIVTGRLLVTLDEDWILSGSTRFAAGSMISYGLSKWKQDPLRAMPSLVFQPEPRQALSGFAVTKNLLILAIPDNIQSKAFIYRYDQGTWRAAPIPLPTNENVSLSAASEETDVVLFTVSNYLGPTSLWYFDAASERLEILRTTLPKFNASRQVAEQFEATSLDGTRIPYFLVRPKNARFGAEIPALLNGYGGFQASLLPSYAGAMGRLWPEQGNAHVVANLRGGAEFGPRWHEPAQAATKQRTWDDFIAFAEDLIRRRSPLHADWAWSAPAREVCWWAPRLLSAGTSSTQRSCRWRCSTCFGSPSWDGDPTIPSSADGSRPTRPIRSLSRARPTQSPSFSPPPRTTACIRPTAARQPLGLLRSASPITTMRISTADIARPPISRDTRDGWHSNTPMHPGGLWIECG